MAEPLTADDVRQRYKLIECVTCGANCTTTVSDTLEIIDGTPVFRVEVFCNSCGQSDTITIVTVAEVPLLKAGE